MLQQEPNSSTNRIPPRNPIQKRVGFNDIQRGGQEELARFHEENGTHMEQEQQTVGTEDEIEKQVEQFYRARLSKETTKKGMYANLKENASTFAIRSITKYAGVGSTSASALIKTIRIIGFILPVLPWILGGVFIIGVVASFLSLIEGNGESSKNTMNQCTGSGCDIEFTMMGKSIAMSMYTRDGYFMPVGSPVEGKVTQWEYDNKSWYQSMFHTMFLGHNGVDIGGNAGKPAYALGPGYVVYSYNNTDDSANLMKAYGCLAKVYYQGLNDKVTTCYYGHFIPETCSTHPLLTQIPVTAWTEIGKVGATGDAQGVHLHYECRQENKLYSLTTSQFLGLSIPGKNADTSKLPFISLGIPATKTSGIDFIKNTVGGVNSDGLEKTMGDWYKYLSNTTAVRSNGIDPLRIMALLYRERTSFLVNNTVTMAGPQNYEYNPFQIGTDARGVPRVSTSGCNPETFGNFDNELDCFFKTTQTKALATESKENPLASSTLPYYFGQITFAYNGVLESPLWQSAHCYGQYNQNIEKSDDKGDNTVKYTRVACLNDSGDGDYNAKLASRDFWYSSYVMNGLGFAWQNMPFRGNHSDDKMGVMSFYSLLKYWQNENFMSPTMLAAQGN